MATFDHARMRAGGLRCFCVFAAFSGAFTEVRIRGVRLWKLALPPCACQSLETSSSAGGLWGAITGVKNLLLPQVTVFCSSRVQKDASARWAVV